MRGVKVVRYLADCLFPGGLTRQRLEELSKEAQRDFGDPSYHMLASVSGGRVFGIFQADAADTVRQWFMERGSTVEALAPFEVEAELGAVKVHS